MTRLAGLEPQWLCIRPVTGTVVLNQGRFGLPWDIWQCPETFLTVTSGVGGMRLASSGERPGPLLNLLWCTRQPPFSPTKINLAPNVSSAQGKKSWHRGTYVERRGNVILTPMTRMMSCASKSTTLPPYRGGLVPGAPWIPRFTVFKSLLQPSRICGCGTCGQQRRPYYLWQGLWNTLKAILWAAVTAEV